MRLKHLLLSFFVALIAIGNVRGAESSDSVTLSVKWVLGTAKGNKDSYSHLAVINPATGFFKRYETSDLNAYKTNALVPVRVPKGDGYMAVFVFLCNKTESNGIIKLMAHEDMSLQSDTTITFNGGDATRRVAFRYTMPDGSPLSFMSGSGATADWTGANAYQAYFQRSIHVDGVPEFMWYVLTAVTGNSTSVGIDRSQTADVYVNDGISSRFSVQTMIIINPLDTVTHLGNTHTPGVFITLNGNTSVLDTTYSNPVSEFRTLTPLAPRRSLYPVQDAATGWTRKINWVGTGIGALYGFQSVGALYDSIGRVNYYIDHNSMPVLLQLQQAEAKTVIRTGCVEPGSGITLPPYWMTENGVEKYYMYDNITQGYQTYLGDDKGVIRMYPGNEFYTFTPEGQSPDFGNSAPMLTFSMTWKAASGAYLRAYPTLFTNAEWMGNWGERRCIDLLANKIAVTAGQDTLATTWKTIVSGIANFEKTQHDPTRIKIEFDNTNFMVDSLQGRSLAIFEYNDGNADINPPSLQMLQYRTSNGFITNKFDSFSDAELYFNAGDLNYANNDVCVYFKYAPTQVKVEISKHGRDEWTELTAEQQPSMFMMPVWGMGYKVALSQFPQQKNDHYYDLRLTLTDEAGNRSVQTLGPSFFVKGDKVSGVDDVAESQELTVRMNEHNLEVYGAYNPEVTVYSLSGEVIGQYHATSVDVSNLAKGVYVVRVVDGSKTATLKVLKQ